MKRREFWIEANEWPGRRNIFGATNRKVDSTSACEVIHTREVSPAYDECFNEMKSVLNECAEVLSLAREGLGMCGEGDHKDRKADGEDKYQLSFALGLVQSALKKTEALKNDHI